MILCAVSQTCSHEARISDAENKTREPPGRHKYDIPQPPPISSAPLERSQPCRESCSLLSLSGHQLDSTEYFLGAGESHMPHEIEDRYNSRLR